MKKTKILVPALSVLALGMAAAVTGTVAWFSANNIVTSNGMKFKSVTPSSLAITKTLDGNGFDGKATTISWNEQARAVNPISHWHGEETPNTGNGAGTYYTVDNGQYIDPVSGLASLNDVNGTNSNPANATYDQYENITFAAASGTDYYVDYKCYIASVGASILIGQNGYLRATPTITSTSSTQNDTLHAATVDFFVYKLAKWDDTAGASGALVEGAATYVQGVNEIGLDYRDDLHATYPGEVATLGDTEKTYADICVGGDTIPNTQSKEAIMVIMRFYFDGALLKDSNNAYIATNRVDTADISVNVSFSLSRE